MLLCVDVGNTQTVLGTFDGDRMAHSWRIKTDARATADELALTVRGLLASEAVDITGIAACSTVPAVLHELRAMFARYFAKVPVLVVEPGVRTGVQLAYHNPREVGTDRVMNTLAAHAMYGGPAVVVDFGTSTSFDVVGESGAFLGGALAPGVEISADALASRAAQLVKVELARPPRAIGKSTVEALQSGIIYGVAGQVDGIVGRISDELGPLRAVIATGGLAPLVINECRTVTDHEPHLTLIGLRLVYGKNHQSGH